MNRNIKRLIWGIALTPFILGLLFTVVVFIITPTHANKLAQYRNDTNALASALSTLVRNGCQPNEIWWITMPPEKETKKECVLYKDPENKYIGGILDYNHSTAALYHISQVSVPGLGTDASEVVLISYTFFPSGDVDFLSAPSVPDKDEKDFCDFINAKNGITYDYLLPHEGYRYSDLKVTAKTTPLMELQDYPSHDEIIDLEKFKGKTEGCVYTRDYGYAYFRVAAIR